ncbi:unnamed protein product [marine sediment metagenome]|uniref:DNA (cytosine-5-)-methyltransferase n=1 Tax=marine sediment metagenome TaxID=412755 RepID=X1T043_9ZZZZ
MKPRLLDLFCGAGGTSMGYYRAGFQLYGIDNKPQPHYPSPAKWAKLSLAEKVIGTQTADELLKMRICDVL